MRGRIQEGELTLGQGHSIIFNDRRDTGYMPTAAGWHVGILSMK